MHPSENVALAPVRLLPSPCTRGSYTGQLVGDHRPILSRLAPFSSSFIYKFLDSPPMSESKSDATPIVVSSIFLSLFFLLFCNWCEAGYGQGLNGLQRHIPLLCCTLALAVAILGIVDAFIVPVFGRIFAPVSSVVALATIVLSATFIAWDEVSGRVSFGPYGATMFAMMALACNIVMYHIPMLRGTKYIVGTG